MKEKKTALILCLLLGTLGIHRFYLGQTGKGLLYLFTLGLVGVLPFIDLIVWLLGSQESFDNKYNTQAIQKQMLDEIKRYKNIDSDFSTYMGD